MPAALQALCAAGHGPIACSLLGLEVTVPCGPQHSQLPANYCTAHTVESVRLSHCCSTPSVWARSCLLWTTACLCAWLWALQRRAPAMAEGGNSDVISVNAPAGSAESVWLTEGDILAQLGISVGEVGATASL